MKNITKVNPTISNSNSVTPQSPAKLTKNESLKNYEQNVEAESSVRAADSPYYQNNGTPMAYAPQPVYAPQQYPPPPPQPGYYATTPERTAYTPEQRGYNSAERRRTSFAQQSSLASDDSEEGKRKSDGESES